MGLRDLPIGGCDASKRFEEWERSATGEPEPDRLKPERQQKTQWRSEKKRGERPAPAAPARSSGFRAASLDEGDLDGLLLEDAGEGFLHLLDSLLRVAGDHLVGGEGGAGE